MSPILTIQKRMMELGRVRLGDKSASGAPRKLNTFRFTSASRVLLDAIAEKYGGEVHEWKGAPDEGYFEVTTTSRELEILFPPVYSNEDGTPTVPFSQWLELWSGGGCQRRCDGETEALSGKPCMCDPDNRACKPTTRISFMLPDIPGLGLWRVESHGWNAAAETPGAVEVLVRAASEGVFIPAVLRLENRTSKKGNQTRRFVVPVIDVQGTTVNQLAGGNLPLAINAPRVPAGRPALPAGPPAPEVAETFELEAAPDDAGFGEAPQLPMSSNEKQEAFPGQATSAAPGITDDERRSSDSSGQAILGLAAERNAGAPGPKSEQAQLVDRLLAALTTLGLKEDDAFAAIAKNRASNEDDPAKHLTWLRGQVTRAENQAKEASAE